MFARHSQGPLPVLKRSHATPRGTEITPEFLVAGKKRQRLPSIWTPTEAQRGPCSHARPSPCAVWFAGCARSCCAAARARAQPVCGRAVSLLAYLVSVAGSCCAAARRRTEDQRRRLVTTERRGRARALRPVQRHQPRGGRRGQREKLFLRALRRRATVRLAPSRAAARGTTHAAPRHSPLLCAARPRARLVGRARRHPRPPSTR